MQIFKIFILALICSGCATQGQKLKASLQGQYPDQKVLDVPFYAQEKYFCGPASLSIMANNLGLVTSSDELAPMIYSPEAHGTFQNDIISATRRLGLIAVPVNNLKNIVQEINDEHPIMVFQNLGLSWIPKWHYAVVTGYDLSKNEIILHTGEYKNYRLSFTAFENTWERVSYWGLVIVKPGVIPKTANELDVVVATAGLELLNKWEEAKISYEKILERWPQSLGALVGLGNVYFNKKDYKKASEYLKLATAAHPQSVGAKNNYELASKAYLDEQKTNKNSINTKGRQ
ncbi:MAG: PA2778 family cysteine peptidase [Bacteriovorax sp.]|nr:PA2778 family cysteine peptidase [Bacteriovorax sp.]